MDALGTNGPARALGCVHVAPLLSKAESSELLQASQAALRHGEWKINGYQPFRLGTAHVPSSSLKGAKDAAPLPVPSQRLTPQQVRKVTFLPGENLVPQKQKAHTS